MGRIVFKLERRSGQKDRNIPGVNIYYFNNLVTSEARPGQTRQFIVSMQMSLSLEAELVSVSIVMCVLD